MLLLLQKMRWGSLRRAVNLVGFAGLCIAAGVPAAAGVPPRALGAPVENTQWNEKVVLHVLPPSSGLPLSHPGLPAGGASFKSVIEARDHLRELRQHHALPHGATVLLHDGVHRPFHLDAALDSGTPGGPIRYAAATGESAVVSGGVPIPAASFKPWNGGQAGILRADLAPLGIPAAALGGMQIPPSEGTMTFGDCQHDKAELFYRGSWMLLARYPNVLRSGTWQFLHADVAGKFGASGSGGAWFLMKSGENASRIAGWATKDHGTAWLHGYWEFDWADSYRQLDSVQWVTVEGVQYLNVSFIPGGGNVADGLQVRLPKRPPSHSRFRLHSATRIQVWTRFTAGLGATP